jgi:hypothetical protein
MIVDPGWVLFTMATIFLVLGYIGMMPRSAAITLSERRCTQPATPRMNDSMVLPFRRHAR